MIALRSTNRAGVAVNLHIHVNLGSITIPLSERQLVKFLAHADTASQGKQVRSVFSHFTIASYQVQGMDPFTMITADGVNCRLDVTPDDWDALLRTTTTVTKAA